MRIIFLGAVISVCALFAQDTDSARVYKIGNGVGPPSLIRKVEPKYSKEARIARLEGTVILQIVISNDGKARDFQVLRSVGLGLDQNAIAAVAAWEFGPSIKDGQPVSVQAQIEVNFRLGLNPKVFKWRTTRVDLHVPEGAVRPVIDKATGPRIADNAASATATVTFDIDEKGEPANLRIDKSSDDEWARNVTDAVSKWRFTPASKDANPVSVSCTMDFVRGN